MKIFRKNKQNMKIMMKPKKKSGDENILFEWTGELWIKVMLTL